MLKASPATWAATPMRAWPTSSTRWSATMMEDVLTIARRQNPRPKSGGGASRACSSPFEDVIKLQPRARNMDDPRPDPDRAHRHRAEREHRTPPLPRRHPVLARLAGASHGRARARLGRAGGAARGHRRAPRHHRPRAGDGGPRRDRGSNSTKEDRAFFRLTSKTPCAARVRPREEPRRRDQCPTEDKASKTVGSEPEKKIKYALDKVSNVPVSQGGFRVRRRPGLPRDRPLRHQGNAAAEMDRSPVPPDRRPLGDRALIDARDRNAHAFMHATRPRPGRVPVADQSRSSAVFGSPRASLKRAAHGQDHSPRSNRSLQSRASTRIFGARAG